MLSADIERLDALVRRLEDEMDRSPVRGLVGWHSGDGIESVMVFPEIPVGEPQIIFVVSSRLTNFIPPLPPVVPEPSKLDTYWYAAPGDSRWHPIGGKLSRLWGEPGTISQALVWGE